MADEDDTPRPRGLMSGRVPTVRAPDDIRNHPVMREMIARQMLEVMEHIRQRLRVEVVIDRDVREMSYHVSLRAALDGAVRSVFRVAEYDLQDRREIRPARNPILMARPEQMMSTFSPILTPTPPARTRPSGPLVARPTTPPEPKKPRGRVLDFGDE